MTAPQIGRRVDADFVLAQYRLFVGKSWATDKELYAFLTIPSRERDLFLLREGVRIAHESLYGTQTIKTPTSHA